MTTNDPMLGSESPDPPELPTEQELEEPHDPYAALRNKDYRQYFAGNAFSLIGMQMAGVTIGWELYGLTNSKTALGLVGLVQIVPIVLLALPAGHIVDRVNRKRLVLLLSALSAVLFFAMGLSSRFAGMIPGNVVVDSVNGTLGKLAWMLGERGAHFTDPQVPILFLLLLLSGILRSMNQPAKQSIMPMLIPAKDFSNAVAWSSSLFEMSNMIGPTIAGVAIGVLQGNDTERAGTWWYAGIYWATAVFQVVQLVNFSLIHLTHAPRPKEPMSLKSMLGGVHFVTSNKVVLGAMTLDMFAVLLGGATALLPVFAKDILHVGAMGMGALRAAPSVGAFGMGMVLAHMPPMKHAGRNMLIAVVGFGLATIVFGFSTMFVVSLLALAVTGMCDNLSVVVRHSLVQLMTPDGLRGRVNAVNSVFISCSNELGAFESGATAAVFGPMWSVVGGGIGTVLVVGIVAVVWPQVRAVKRLKDHAAE